MASAAAVLTEASVERVGPDTVAVRWSWADTQRSPVTVIASTSVLSDDERPGRRDGPEAITATAAAGATELRLEVPAHPHRVYLVRAEDGPEVVVAERRLPIAGTLNFRDLGGYVGIEARRVCWGRVFRSDNLAAVDDDGWAAIADLGVRTVYDLRHEAERQRAPSRPPTNAAIEHRHLPIGGEAAEAPDLIDLLRRETGRFGLDFMVDMNRALLNEHATVFGTLISNLSEPDHLPAIFHCTAGKDRTGAAAALILSALGVDRETILNDYELTTFYRSAHRIEQLRPALEEAGVDVEDVRAFLSAPRPALATALADVDATYGSVERYLIDVARVSPDTLARLRAHLLADT